MHRHTDWNVTKSSLDRGKKRAYTRSHENLGKIRRVLQQAAHLEQLDQKYVPFANKLRELAHNFEDEKIVALVEKYWKKNITENEKRNHENNETFI